MHKTSTGYWRTFLALSLCGNLIVGIYGAHKMYVTMRKRADRALIEAAFVEPPNNQPYFLGRDQVFRSMPVDSGALIFLGNSLTQQCEFAELFPNKKILNRGIVADVTDGVLARLDEVCRHTPSKVFLEIGINDLLIGRTLTSTQQTLAAIVTSLQQKSPSTTIFLQSLLPTNNMSVNRSSSLPDTIVAYNTFLKKIALEKKCVYVDLYTPFCNNRALDKRYDCGDGLHLSGAGYLLWRDCIKEYVLQ